jgi:DNA-binding beta-propeller fold protein YncE
MSNVYVADSQNNRVQKFDSNGNFLFAWGSRGTGDGQFNTPLYLAIGRADKNVFVLDSQNHRVQKFNTDGRFVAKFGSVGSGNGQFLTLYGLAVNDFGNLVYVSDVDQSSGGDRNHNRIQKFDSGLNYVTQWGSYGLNNGQFYDCGLATDTGGNVYVADHNNNRIQKFDANGNFLAKWGNTSLTSRLGGRANGQFNCAWALALDYSGNVYVVDMNNHRVQKFRKLSIEAAPATMVPLGIVTTTTGRSTTTTLFGGGGVVRPAVSPFIIR